MATEGERWIKLKLLLMDNPNGIKMGDIVEHMGENRLTVFRDLKSIGAISPKKGIWFYAPNARDIELAKKIIATDWQLKK